MSVRVRYSIIAAVSSTTAEEKDLGNTNWQVVSDGEAKGGTSKTSLGGGGSQTQLNLSNMASVDLLIIRITPTNPTQTPNAVTFWINSSSGPGILVQPLSTTLEGHLLLSTSGLTALWAQNAGAVSMDVTIVGAGSS